ncbi:EamA family transporter [Salmonella enterica]|jgi:DME family drug/metabolite transporter|nr:EamA family transporter [Salmonella enterica subsp. enterica serovar Typhimurium]EBY6849796.1 EamA/RhaT family transporter [Salmonella enterica subsp. enterica serovar Bonn]ECF0564691.1 EamA/RhaT family transporter [Salmonella enterica subsp. enterica serovar Heidelberg]ECZ7909555.1 EamA family transporter [Salmonella enterica subsp. enterica serovar Muenchen]EKN4992235.1 EamA family transporter [Salmonella enterica]HEC6213009.1 EamA family transporter [Salmonella enterica subsp. enterica s
MKKNSVVGIMLALCAAFLWGTAGTAQSFVHGATAPYWIGAFRLMIACMFFHLLFFCRSTSTKTTVATVSNSSLQISRTKYWYFICIAGVSMGVYNLAFFAGIQATGIATGTATTIGSAPIWAGLMQAIVMKRPPSKLWWLGTLCATAGGSWMVFSQSESWKINNTGLLICLSAGFCYALYTVCSKKLVSFASPLTITKHTFSIAIFIATSVAWLLAGTPTLTLISIGVILYLGLLTTGIAYLLFTQALRHISASTGVALGLIEPIVAFILAIVVAHEAVNRFAVIGLCLILAGLWLVLRSEGQQNR